MKRWNALLLVLVFATTIFSGRTVSAAGEMSPLTPSHTLFSPLSKVHSSLIFSPAPKMLQKNPLHAPHRQARYIMNIFKYAHLALATPFDSPIRISVRAEVLTLPSPVTVHTPPGAVLVGATPYDRRLAASGFYETGDGDGSASLDSLFAKARSFRYVKDRSGDRWQSAEETDMKRSGDCEDKAVWLYTEMKRNGYTDTRLVVGKYRPHERTYHVWVVYDGDGDPVILDPTIQKRVWKSSGLSSGFYKESYSYDSQYRFRHTA